MAELNGNVKVVRDHITLDKESVEALRQFIGEVYLMRQAQELYEVLPEDKYLTNKLQLEQSVDEQLSILVKKS